MKSWLWFRAMAVFLLLFTIGHTVGTMHPVTKSAEEAAVIGAMQQYRVPVMGFLRSYWEFYRGFSLSVSVLLAALAVIAWQLGTLSRRNPREALPLSITMLVASIANAVVTFAYFFTPPMVIATVAVICAAIGVVLTRREVASPP